MGNSTQTHAKLGSAAQKHILIPKHHTLAILFASLGFSVFKKCFLLCEGEKKSQKIV